MRPVLPVSTAAATSPKVCLYFEVVTGGGGQEVSGGAWAVITENPYYVIQGY